MTAPAPLGHTSTEPRAVNRETNSTREMSTPCPESEVSAAREALAQRGQRVTRSGIRRLYRFYLAQADHAADFMTWITYQDPTGEHATNRVLRDQAKEISTWQ